MREIREYKVHVPTYPSSVIFRLLKDGIFLYSNPRLGGANEIIISLLINTEQPLRDIKFTLIQNNVSITTGDEDLSYLTTVENSYHEIYHVFWKELD